MMSELPTLAGLDGRGFGINDLGQVVGISNSGSGFQHGFLHESGAITATDLGTALAGDKSSTANAINEWGQIAAWSGPFNNVMDAKAYLYESGVWTPLGTLGGTRSASFGLDDAGRVVGWSDVAGDITFHAFLWADGQMTDLGTLGGPTSIAADVHDAGPMVGWSDMPNGSLTQHAFVYAGGEMADLNTLIPDGTGWELTFAVSVNAVGQIVGRGQIGGEDHAYLATPATVKIDELADVVESFALPRGIENSLLVKLNTARAALESCSPTTACAPLGAFVKQVEAQSGKKLTTQQADSLLAAVAELRVALGCL